MNCRLCKGENVQIMYRGPIRDGSPGNYYSEEVPVYRCGDCGTMFHFAYNYDFKDYYESEAYRLHVDGSAAVADYFALHDEENLEKLI